MINFTTAREVSLSPEQRIRDIFGEYCTKEVDGFFEGFGSNQCAGISGLPFKAPVMQKLKTNSNFTQFIQEEFKKGNSILINAVDKDKIIFLIENGGLISQYKTNENLEKYISKILAEIPSWAGSLNEKGEHVIDLMSPSPGPHFFVNLLIGNRIGFDFPLQTTPKSVVNRLGGGSFRSHAATQVLATRWDLRQEENGFPVNRQFYLVENGQQIFYSASPNDPNVKAGSCLHSQNRTVITYETNCGLRIERRIFLPSQKPGFPLAVEAHSICIINDTNRRRDIRIVVTGMFGPSKPQALQEDVLYSTIIMQGGVLHSSDGSILAVSPQYQPLQDRLDRRFHSMIVHSGNGVRYPKEFCLSYEDFVGSGTIEYPDGLFMSSNRLTRKGPGFFALSDNLNIKPGCVIQIDNFTGLVSSKGDEDYNQDTMNVQIKKLIGYYNDPKIVSDDLRKVTEFQRSYSSFLQIETEDQRFSSWFNGNLPFQVFYQTFVSRSFGQTQKGYREIGFREIQDLFASMYYLHARGDTALVRRLILDWASHVHPFGYANHNFFWEGKEPGKWSDDALWLHQAVGRYINLTGDSSILDANPGGNDSRALYNILISALKYSTEISVGPHGLPLLDLADWNDCLKIDNDYLTGAKKEELWRLYGSLNSNGTESVMNGFLAVQAAKIIHSLARDRGDGKNTDWALSIISSLTSRLHEHAWKSRNYARLLFNKYPGYTYAGADGDGLDTDGSGGTMFLNSFSWSILSGVANEQQIESMLTIVRNKLKTPFGLKLVSPSDLSRVVSDTATAEYYPGDRENGAVFKHAAMMAVASMFEAAKFVDSNELARQLSLEAWEMVDVAIPPRSMDNPYELSGNPRFCTQYNNSETGENIGPLLSGTASWMILSLLKGFGIEFTSEGLTIEPILREKDTHITLSLKIGEMKILLEYIKPKGFYRPSSSNFILSLDGVPQIGRSISLDKLKDGSKILGKFSDY